MKSWNWTPPPSHAGWARNADGNWQKMVEGTAQHCFDMLLDLGAFAALSTGTMRGSELLAKHRSSQPFTVSMPARALGMTNTVVSRGADRPSKSPQSSRAS